MGVFRTSNVDEFFVKVDKHEDRLIEIKPYITNANAGKWNGWCYQYNFTLLSEHAKYTFLAKHIVEMTQIPEKKMLSNMKDLTDKVEMNIKEMGYAILPKDPKTGHAWIHRTVKETNKKLFT